jgi:hypothetical protein
MALTRLELGNLYYEKGGILEKKFLGTVLHMAQQIKGGGYPSPTAEQTAWANATIGTTSADREKEARAAMEWGLVNNTALQAAGEDATDSDLDYIVAEYAKTYVG